MRRAHSVPVQPRFNNPRRRVGRWTGAQSIGGSRGGTRSQRVAATRREVVLPPARHGTSCGIKRSCFPPWRPGELDRFETLSTQLDSLLTCAARGWACLSRPSPTTDDARGPEQPARSEGPPRRPPHCRRTDCVSSIRCPAFLPDHDPLPGCGSRSATGGSRGCWPCRRQRRRVQTGRDRGQRRQEVERNRPVNSRRGS